MLFADTFNRYFERENLDAALSVLVAGGYRVHAAMPADGTTRPLCCGRTFLSVGKVDEARAEMRRTLAALAPFAMRGIPIVGLEPSCLLTLRDELPALLKGEVADKIATRRLTPLPGLQHFTAWSESRRRASGTNRAPPRTT